MVICDCTQLVHDARVRFRREFRTSQYGEVERLLYVPLAAAQGKSGLVAVVHFYWIDHLINREGTLCHRYRRLTNNDVVMEPSQARAADLADQNYVFVRISNARLPSWKLTIYHKWERGGQCLMGHQAQRMDDLM